jgi:hypothetical protein
MEFALVSQFEEDTSDALQELVPFTPKFFIPILPDKPQDPILDTLKREQAVHAKPVQLSDLPPELTFLLEPSFTPRRNDSLWIDAIKKHNISGRVRLLARAPWSHLTPF